MAETAAVMGGRLTADVEKLKRRGRVMTENERIMRQEFMPIAVVEHHQMIDPVLDVYDICDRVGPLWLDIRREAEANTFTLDADCVLSINERIARALGMDAGVFRNKDGWASFLGELDVLGGIENDPAHICSWIFSALYWNHLTRFRLATAWLFMNAIRIQHKLPEYGLTLDKLGAFLDSLSASGPPIYDGQTLYPEDYSA